MTPAAFPSPETQPSNAATREADARRPLAEAPEPFRLLLLVASPEHAQAFEFGSHRMLTLGRAAPADIQLADPSLSRLHARFTREGEAVRVTDLDSRNGTWVLGERIRETVLRPGQSVVLGGGVTVTLQMSASAGTAMLGLRSAETMLRCIEEEWTRAQAFRRPLSVLILRALRRGEVSAAEIAADRLPKLRPIDRAGLYDKNALLILLPEAGAEIALRVGQELCAAVRGRGQLVSGIATYPDAGTSPGQLVSAAWQASQEASASRLVCAAPRAPHVRDPQTDTIVRKSQAMLELSRMALRVASRPIAVLVTGETGTGKELIARELHQHSSRSANKLLVVNCAAIPDNLIESVLFGHVKGAFTGADRDYPGVFEQADGGTVFLDEVGELSADAQAALLRVLDTRRVSRVGGTGEVDVDVRVVAATHRDLATMSEQGSFRLDLYHRLNGVVLELPPLRHRPEEIDALVAHFLELTATRWGGRKLAISDDALARMRAYHWPGNVRELRNVIERGVALAEGDTLTLADLPAHVLSARAGRTDPPPGFALASVSTVPAPAPSIAPEGVDLRNAMLEHEVALIREALRLSQGNQRKAALLLKLPLRTFERKLKQLGVRSKDVA